MKFQSPFSVSIQGRSIPGTLSCCTRKVYRRNATGRGVPNHNWHAHVEAERPVAKDVHDAGSNSHKSLRFKWCNRTAGKRDV
ncbi:MAG: hypothetical protein ABJ091_11970 [Lentilitoribacter sp.]